MTPLPLSLHFFTTHSPLPLYIKPTLPFLSRSKPPPILTPKPPTASSISCDDDITSRSSMLAALIVHLSRESARATGDIGGRGGYGGDKGAMVVVVMVDEAAAVEAAVKADMAEAQSLRHNLDAMDALKRHRRRWMLSDSARRTKQ